MLAKTALDALAQGLATAIGAMGVHDGVFGNPELVEMPARDAERLFHGYGKAKPNAEDAYAVARAFVRGHVLDAWQRDLIASALAVPIKEQSGALALSAKGFHALLAGYEAELKDGQLWRLTWHGLLYSYFNYSLNAADDDKNRNGWNLLREFLERTWPELNRQTGAALVPDWVGVLRREVDVLSRNPVEKYARAYLNGETEAVDQLAVDLGIPPSSWFWHALVLGAVKNAIAEDDTAFRDHIPRLLELIEGKQAFRDEALESILIRYSRCTDAPQDEQLRDFVCLAWKNPKLKAAGIATAWNRVPDSVWQMVLGWVNERNLKDFFDILAARNKADAGRLAFWSKYLKQIVWTRLVFGADTMALKRTNPDIRDLIAREEGSYAQLTDKREVDAFMMQVGRYLIIEFSKKPNACYVYQADQLPFEPYSRYYGGGTDDLGAGYRDGCALRIVHTPGWGRRAEVDLRNLGILPDRHVPRAGAAKTGHASSTPNRTIADTPIPGGPDMQALDALVRRYSGVKIHDSRVAVGGGRLWVVDPMQRAQLHSELTARGFKWAKSSQAWYFPET